jgi:RHS repeat-associated protein
MNDSPFHHRLPRGRLWLGLLLATAGVLWGKPAAAQSFYESNRSYFFGMGSIRAGVPGGAVDLPTGALTVRVPLPPLPGRVHHQLACYFNSQDSGLGPLGQGTSLSVSTFLAYGPSGGVDLILPGHRRFEFSFNWTDYAYEDARDPEMLGAKFTQGAGQTGLAGTMRLRNGDQLLFDNQGNCWQQQDRYGNFINIDGGTFPQAVRLGGSYYPRVDFTYTSGRVTQIRYSYLASSPLNRSWTLAYDGNLRLSTITDPLGGVTRYTWQTYTRSDGQVLPLISTITTPRGSATVPPFAALTALYDSTGRLTRVTGADGSYSTLSYSAAIGSDGTTTLSDPLSHTTSWSYTWPAPPAGETAKFGYRLTSTVDPLGRQTQYAATHAGSNLVTQITDYRNRVKTLNWDYTRGNLLTITRPTATGGTATTTATYEAGCSECTSMTDPLGRQTSSTVDPANGNVTQTTDAIGNHGTYSYSAYGDVASTTNALSEHRYLSYTYYGDLNQVTDGIATRWSAKYDDAARKVTETDANGKVTRFSYDALDRLLSTSRTLGAQAVTTSFTYDQDGHRTQLTDPNGHAWQWVFDVMGRVSQELTPLSTISPPTGIAYNSYDAAGNLSLRTDRAGQQGVFAFDAANRPTSEIFKRANGTVESTISYNYDPTTHLLTSVSDTGIGPTNNTTAWTYDSLDRTISETGPNGSLAFTLDPVLNRRTALQVSGQGLISYGFDNNSNVVSITQNGLTTWTAYDALNRPSGRSLPSGVNTHWYYDSHGFVSQILTNNGTLDGHGFTRDAMGNVVQEQVNGATWTYGYDDLYRLSAASVLGTNYSWVYDLAGNRTQQTAGAVVTNYTVNAADQLTGVNRTAIFTDANGNVTQDETGGLYSWDVRGRLSQLTRSGSTSLFNYDQDGRRIKKSVGSASTSYLLDGDGVVQENSGGTLTNLLHGPGTDNLLQRGSNWFVPASLNSTSTMVDGTGAVLQRYYYQPFGQLSMQGGGSPQPYQFTGREADESGLMCYRARYYNPNWGRFVSADPAGFGGGINPYVYAGNNPATYGDPTGRQYGTTGMEGEGVGGLGAAGYPGYANEFGPTGDLGSTGDAGAAGIVAESELAAADARLAAAESAGSDPAAAEADVTEAAMAYSDANAGMPDGTAAGSSGDGTGSGGIANPDGLSNNLGVDLYFHYTNQIGVDGIMKDGLIRANAEGNVYLTQDMLNPGEAENGLFGGFPSHAGRGDFIVGVKVRPGVGLSPDPGSRSGLIHPGSIRFDVHQLVYAGRNPF